MLLRFHCIQRAEADIGISTESGARHVTHLADYVNYSASWRDVLKFAACIRQVQRVKVELTLYFHADK
jgi:hypothetical protein